MKSKIIEFADVSKSEFGYQYISHWEEFYDIEYGMDDSKFFSNETQFL